MAVASARRLDWESSKRISIIRRHLHFHAYTETNYLESRCPHFVGCVRKLIRMPHANKTDCIVSNASFGQCN